MKSFAGASSVYRNAGTRRARRRHFFCTSLAHSSFHRSGIALPALRPPPDANLAVRARSGSSAETGCIFGTDTWHKCLYAVKHRTDGEQYLRVSANHAGYDAAETQAKTNA